MPEPYINFLYEDITINSVHPDGIFTGLFTKNNSENKIIFTP